MFPFSVNLSLCEGHSSDLVLTQCELVPSSWFDSCSFVFVQIFAAMHSSLTFCMIPFGNGFVLNKIFIQDQGLLSISEMNAGVLTGRSCVCVNCFYWSIKKRPLAKKELLPLGKLEGQDLRLVSQPSFYQCFEFKLAVNPGAQVFFSLLLQLWLCMAVLLHICLFCQNHLCVGGLNCDEEF